jgi:hypothetical protein
MVASVGLTRGGAALTVSPSGKFIAVTTAAAAEARFLKLKYDPSHVFQTRSATLVASGMPKPALDGQDLGYAVRQQRATGTNIQRGDCKI